jgi:hypothetical protein
VPTQKIGTRKSEYRCSWHTGGKWAIADPWHVWLVMGWLLRMGRGWLLRTVAAYSKSFLTLRLGSWQSQRRAKQRRTEHFCPWELIKMPDSLTVEHPKSCRLKQR